MIVSEEVRKVGINFKVRKNIYKYKYAKKCDEWWMCTNN